MADIDAAFDDAYRTHRIEAGDDPQTLPNPYSRPTLGEVAAGPDHTGAGVGGGFMVDDAAEHQEAGGGFMTDDAPGGFMVDDDDIESARAGDGDDDGLGSSSPRVTQPNAIPLSAIPEALANLGLDSTDSSVLSLFAETAYVPSSASRRRLAPVSSRTRWWAGKSFSRWLRCCSKSSGTGLQRGSAAQKAVVEAKWTKTMRLPPRGAAPRGVLR